MLLIQCCSRFTSAGRVRFALLPNAPSDSPAQFELLLKDWNRIVAMKQQQKPAAAEEAAGARSKSPGPGTPGPAGATPADGVDEKPNLMTVLLPGSAEVPTDGTILSNVLTVKIATKPESDRDETLIIKYDGHFRLDQAFHVEVQWLEATACLVDQLVERWVKRAETRGFRLVSVPIVLEDQSIDSSEIPNPFREVRQLGHRFGTMFTHNLRATPRYTRYGMSLLIG